MNQTFKSACLVVAMVFPGTVGVGSWIASSIACTPQEAKTVVQDALTLANIACIMSSEFTDEQAVMEVCHIEQALAPLVEPLLASKKAAKRNAACTDAGK